MRVKGGFTTQRRHKKILKMTKGQWGTKHRLFRRANEAMMKSYWYAYRDRRQRRRDFSSPLDCPYQRCIPSKRDELQSFGTRLEVGKRPARPQGFG